MKLFPLLLPAMILCFPLSQAAAQDRDDKGGAGGDGGGGVGEVPEIDFEIERLENGLTVIYAPMDNAPVTHVRVLYHVGSRDETPDRQGFAHMFEHMMFRGSEHVPSERHMELINGVGGSSNAFTSFDQTTYVNTIPSNALEMALWLEADRMGGFKVDREKFVTERNVVNEEYLQRVVNPPYGRMFMDFFALAYEDSHYKWTPIGDMEHLGKAQPQELQEFFDTYYVPNNAVLTIAGDFDVDEAKQWVRDYYGWIPRGDEISRRSPSEPAQGEKRHKVVHLPNIPLPRVIMGYKTTTYADPDQEVLEVLGNILGQGRSSRLYEALVAGPDPIANMASAGSQRLEDTGMFIISVGLLPGKDPDEAEKRVLKAVKRLIKEGVTEEELAKAKTQLRLNLLDQRQTASSVATALAEAQAFGGDAKLVNEQVGRREKITAEDVQRVAKEFLDEQRLSVLQYLPGEAPGRQKAAGGAEVEAEGHVLIEPAGDPGAIKILDAEGWRKEAMAALQRAAVRSAELKGSSKPADQVVAAQAEPSTQPQAPVPAPRQNPGVGPAPGMLLGTVPVSQEDALNRAIQRLQEDATAAMAEGRKAHAFNILTQLNEIDPNNELVRRLAPELQLEQKQPEHKRRVHQKRQSDRDVQFPPDYPKTPPLPDEVVDADFDMGDSFKVGPIEVIVIHDDRLPLVGMTLLLPGGSDAQPEGKEGLATLTADLLTRGAGGMSAAEWSAALESRGIHLSVGDGGDHTRISGGFPAEQMETVAGFVDDLLRRPNMDDGEFRNLKFRSLAGLRQMLANPGSVAGRQMSEALFGDAPEGRQATLESLGAVTLDDVQEWFKAVYNPPTATLILAGDVSRKQAKQFARELTEDLDPGDVVPQADYTLPEVQRRVIVVDNRSGGQSAVRLGGRAFTSDSKDKYAGSVATEILSAGIESRLNRVLRAEKGLTYGASGRFNAGRHAGSFQVSFNTRPETTSEAVESAFEVLERMASEPVTDEELAEAKRRVTGSLVMNTQTVSQLAGLRSSIVLNEYSLDYYDEYADRIAAVTKEDVQRVMRGYASPRRLTVVVVGPAQVVAPQLEPLGDVDVVGMPLSR